MRKSCMFGLLVLCTSAAFAIDATVTSNTKKTGPLSIDGPSDAPKVDNLSIGGPDAQGATIAAADVISRHGAMLSAAPAGEKLSPTAKNSKQSTWFGLRAGPCDDAIWSTGDPDGQDGLSNERGNYGIESYCIDDAQVDSDTTVGAFHWQGMISADYADSTIDVLVLPDNGGVPNSDDGTALFNQNDLNGCRVDMGYQIYGYNVIQYSYYFNGGLSIPAGTTWFAGRPVSGSGGGRSFWATANFGAPAGNPALFRSSYFGIYDWTDYWLNYIYGQSSDQSFCITAAGGGAGVCCLDGDCFESDQSGCEGQGGKYQGDGSVCCSIICPGRAAGCCFDDGTCENLKPADCETAGGIPQGDENLCRGGLCPLPDFCADSLYNQFGYDGVNGMTAQDSNCLSWFESWTADNANFTSSVDITGIVWESIDRVQDVTDGDWMIMYTRNDGAPGKLIASADDQVFDVHLTDGTQIFGGGLWVNVFYYPSTRAVPSSLFFAQRPNVCSTYGQNFWLTAPGDGTTGWFKWTFNGMVWQTATSQGNGPDFSFCVLGTFAGEPYGACCTDGDSICQITTQAECADLDGLWTEEAPCFPSPCANAPGACCFLDPYGCEDGMKQGDCEDRGGVFQGGDTVCAETVCPLPDFCADSLFNAFGYDGVNGLSAQDSTCLNWLESWTTDDASFTQSSDVTGVVWETVDRDQSVSDGDWMVMNMNAGGAPGSVVASADDVAFDVRATDGVTLFGGVHYVNVFYYSTPVRVISTNGYFFAQRPNICSGYYQNFWLTTSNGNGNEGFLKGALFGYPNWTPMSNIGYPGSEFSFCVLGQVSDVPYGACCYDDDTFCKVLTKAECDELGGRYVGDEASCSPSPCTNAPGACCFMDPFGCFDGYKEATCTAEGGEFQGGDTLCADIICPLPDWCGDAYYSQFGFDGVSNFINVQNSLYGLNYRVADDFTAGGPVEITGMVWQEMVYNGGGDPSTLVGADWALYYTSGAGGPGRLIASGDDVSTWQRLRTGEKIYGFYDVYWTWVDFNGATRVVSGDYYLNGRPVVNDYWYAYMLSASGGGSSAYYNYNDGAWYQIGLDFSFCVLGQAADIAFGACCYDDDTFCKLATNAECDDLGGRYVGDDATCVPSPCRNSPGACCFLDPFGCFDNYKQSTCDDEGGVFQGGDTFCSEIVCPLPDWCADSYYSQFGFDGYSNFINVENSLYGLNYRVADDFSAGGSADITGLVYQEMVINNGGDPMNLVGIDYSLWYPANAGGPGKLIASGDEVTTYQRLRTGEKIYGYYDVYWTWVDFTAPVRVVAGDFYIGGRPVVNDAWYAYLLTAPGGGNVAYYEYNESGQWYSTGLEFSFCVRGATAEVSYGGCCTDGDSVCTLLTKSECDAAGGSYYGDESGCFPSPCANALGACCLESGVCEFVSPQGCDELGGEFQGGDVECGQVVCPIPDPCDGAHGEVLYNNSTPDGQNGLWSADGRDVGYLTAYVADDLTFGTDTTIGALHYYDLHQDGAVTGTGDYQILGDSDCLPDDGNLIADVEDVEILSLYTGYNLFGYKVWQNNVEVNQALPAGHYWVALRLNLATYSPSYWATAPLTDCGGAFKSADFGYPDWVNANTQLGYESDFAYCATGSADPCQSVALGDSDGSGVVNFNDIDCFVAAMIDQDTWADCGTTLPPGAYVCANDTDHSETVDFNDIDSFVDCLVNNDSPCP